MAILWVEYPPLQDYPNHLLRMHVLQHLDTKPVYAQNLASDTEFRPNMLIDWLLEVFTSRLSLLAAGRAVLCLLVLLEFLAIGLYLNRFGGGVLGALMSAHLAASWFFLKGNLNFYAAVGLGLLYVLVLWPRSSQLGPRRVALASALAFLLVCAHGFAFLAFAILVCAASIVSAKRSLQQALLRGATLLPPLAVFLFFVLRQTSSSSMLDNRPIWSTSAIELLVWMPLTIWQRFCPPLDNLIGGLAYAILLVSIPAAILRSRRDNVSLESNPLLIFALVSVALYLLLPASLSGGFMHMKYRIGYISVLATAPLVAFIRWPLAKFVGTLFLASACSVSFIHTFQEFQHFDDDAHAFVDLGNQIPRDSLVLTIDLTPMNQPVRPHLHLWSYVCIERNCLSPAFFGVRYIQNVYFTRQLPVPPAGETTPSSWKAISETMRMEQYAAVLIRGRNADGERALGRVLPVAGQNRSGSVFVQPKE